jgi:hypothetical protein
MLHPKTDKLNRFRVIYCIKMVASGDPRFGIKTIHPIRKHLSLLFRAKPTSRFSLRPAHLLRFPHGSRVLLEAFDSAADILRNVCFSGFTAESKWSGISQRQTSRVIAQEVAWSAT